jgi:hypothetical protein
MQVLGYLQVTKTLKYNNMPTKPLGVRAYIDATFAMHDDSKSQTLHYWQRYTFIKTEIFRYGDN